MCEKSLKTSHISIGPATMSKQRQTRILSLHRRAVHFNKCFCVRKKRLFISLTIFHDLCINQISSIRFVRRWMRVAHLWICAISSVNTIFIHIFFWFLFDSFHTISYNFSISFSGIADDFVFNFVECVCVVHMLNQFIKFCFIYILFRVYFWMNICVSVFVVVSVFGFTLLDYLCYRQINN